MPTRSSLLAVLLLLFVLGTLTGCLSSGSQTAANIEPETPQKAVYEVFDTWRQQTAPVFSVTPQGAITSGETVPTTDANYIRFKDLSGEIWSLRLETVTYLTPESAKVYAYYNTISAEHGGLKIIFSMVKDQGKWFMDDMEIIALPVAVVTGTGIKGIITDKVTNLPVTGARVEAYNQSTGTIAGYAVTGSNGFYSIVDLQPGSYYLVVARDGYDSYTISGIVVN